MVDNNYIKVPEVQATLVRFMMLIHPLIHDYHKVEVETNIWVMTKHTFIITILITLYCTNVS